MNATKQHRDKTPGPDWPTWWFARLERAIQERDETEANRCRQELRRLGYDVKSIEVAS